MKSTPFIPALLLCLAGLFSLASCTNNDPVAPTQSTIQNNVQSGNWIISSFVNSGNDETSHFSGFTFSFTSNGVLSSTNGSITHTGTWSINDTNVADDNPDNMHFNITFNAGNNFEDLVEDWHLVSQTSTRIELMHNSGGNGGTDFLTFEKI